MKTFYGRREHDGCRIWVGEGPESDGPAERRLAETELPGCPELFKGQVLPFAWGADGPGTAHAAAALLLQVLGRTPPAATVRAAFPLLRRFLAALPADDFELSEPFLLAFLQAALETRAASPAPAQ